MRGEGEREKRGRGGENTEGKTSTALSKKRRLIRGRRGEEQGREKTEEEALGTESQKKERGKMREGKRRKGRDGVKRMDRLLGLNYKSTMVQYNQEMLVRFLICSHHSLIHLLPTARFAHVVHCAHSFACLLVGK